MGFRFSERFEVIEVKRGGSDKGGGGFEDKVTRVFQVILVALMVMVVYGSGGSTEGRFIKPTRA